MQETWGLLGPDALSGARRVRTLDVGAAVRHFNDLAVPGMGSVWTGRQLLWPLLGIAAAEAVRGSMAVSNIEVANAVEALACRIALREGRRDPRVRGVQKLRGTNDLAFRVVRRPGFYVTQPMRMATVQPLMALGLVDTVSERFNAFRLSDAGRAFIESACGEFEPCLHGHGVLDTLVRWVKGDSEEVHHRERLQAALTPLQPLPPLGAETLRERLVGSDTEGAQRRAAALAWVSRRLDATQPADTWEAGAPPEIAPSHWADMLAGARFFAARDAALALLAAVEATMGPAGTPFPLLLSMPATVEVALQSARTAAQAFLGLPGRTAYHPSASAFCQELVHPEAPQLLLHLVRRDGRVLRLSGDHIVPAQAFEGEAAQPAPSPDAEMEMAALGGDGMGLPPGISPRVRNLFLLALDLQGNLGEWLHSHGEVE